MVGGLWSELVVGGSVLLIKRFEDGDNSASKLWGVPWWIILRKLVALHELRGCFLSHGKFRNIAKYFVDQVRAKFGRSKSVVTFDYECEAWLWCIDSCLDVVFALGVSWHFGVHSNVPLKQNSESCCFWPFIMQQIAVCLMGPRPVSCLCVCVI